MTIKNPTLLARNICEIFGLHATNVKRLSFNWDAEDFASLGKVNVELYVTEGQGQAMRTVLKEYELVEKWPDGNDI